MPLRKLAAYLHRPAVIMDDATKPVDELPKVDLYMLGPPCQSWSTAGKRGGVHDKKGRGKLLFNCKTYVREKTPKIVVVENVPGPYRTSQTKRATLAPPTRVPPI